MVTRRKSESQRTMDNARGSGRVALTALVAVTALVVACRSWDNHFDPIGNHPPTTPSRPSPADSGVVGDSGLVLSWHSHDQDSGDTVDFDISLGTASPPSLVQSGWNDTTFRPTNVAGMTQYYWRVTAYDNHGDSAVGPLWQFQTAAPISVTAPDTGERLEMYTTDTVSWIGGPPAVESTVLYWSVNDGATWNRLGRATSPGQFVWQVPEPATGSARVKVTDHVLADTLAGISGRFEIQDTTSLVTTLSPVLKEAGSGLVVPRLSRFIPQIR